MIIEIETEVSEGTYEEDVITFKKKYVEDKRYIRTYKVNIDCISHWNIYDDGDELLEVHLTSGFIIPLEMMISEFEGHLLTNLETGKTLTVKEQGMLDYLKT